MANTYAIIEAGAVANMAVADAPLYQNWVLAPDGVGIGWHYSDGVFSAPQEPEQPVAALRTCTPAQGLVALFAVKQITEDDVHAGIAAISDPVERYTAQIGFKRATEWQEDSPTMQLVQAMLQLSAQDMRELFDYAQTVRV